MWMFWKSVENVFSFPAFPENNGPIVYILYFVANQGKQGKSNCLLLTSFLESPDCLQLLDDGGEGVGDDGDHDEQGEEEDEHRGHDQLDVSAGHPSVLLHTLIFANSGQDGTHILQFSFQG